MPIPSAKYSTTWPVLENVCVALPAIVRFEEYKLLELSTR